ncbi:MAG: sulfite exporter TauE/SafE family protein [Nannocystales bacterium]
MVTLDAAAVATVLGVLAGVLTSAAGFGGGLVVTLGLSLLLGPAAGLAIGAPALTLGHTHRVLKMRGQWDRKAARALCLGAVPGAVVGAMTLVALPPGAVWWILLSATLLGVAEFSGKIPRTFGRRMLGPGGFGVGFLAAAAGVGGLLLPAVMLGAGLSGAAFVATAATASVCVSAVRIVMYGASGLIDAQTLLLSVGCGAGILMGNAVGLKVLRVMTAKRQRVIAGIVLALCVAASAYGTLTAG